MNHSLEKLSIVDWGLISYQEAFDRQKLLVDQIISQQQPEHLIFCTHPEVLTLGRGTQPGDVFHWTGDVVEVNRGGRATYHGPNQIIAYPILYIGKDGQNSKKIPAQDLHAYMRALELSVVDVLKSYEIEAETQPQKIQVGESTAKEATGVWIGDKKIAAIGIAAKSWVTSHGVAFNLYKEEQAYKGFYPCGFRGEQVTSLEEITGQRPSYDDIRALWSQSLVSRLYK